MSYANDCYKITKRVMEEQAKKYEFQRLIHNLKNLAGKGQFEAFLDPNKYEHVDSLVKLLQQEGFIVEYAPELNIHTISWRNAKDE